MRAYSIFRALAGILILIFVTSYGVSSGVGYIWGFLGAMGSITMLDIVLKAFANTMADYRRNL